MTSILVESIHWMELFWGRCKMSFYLFEQINQIKCGFIEVKNQMGVADNGRKNKHLAALSIINSYFQLLIIFFGTFLFDIFARTICHMPSDYLIGKTIKEAAKLYNI